MPDFQLVQGDALGFLKSMDPVSCVFMDPPDNIKYDYSTYDDNMPKGEYIAWLAKIVEAAIRKADTVWLSFNALYTLEVGAWVLQLQEAYDFDFKPCQQIFTFGQQTKSDLKTCHRPLYRLQRPWASLYPDAVKIESWRLQHGDKRGKEGGCVPGDVYDFRGDVFDYPRVTGNSKQRRPWHSTQLHEGLVERCIRLTTAAGDKVVDPFGGSGTTMRVCQRVPRPCTLVEMDPGYCLNIADENGLDASGAGVWVK